MTFAELTWPKLGQATNAIALLPLGAVEQHGPHLPVGTDTHIVTALAADVERLLPELLLLCPTLAFGASHHHLAFGGTISLRPQRYTQLLVDLVDSLLQSGFRRIVLLNGHGGNITPARQALAELALAAPSANIALATYWEMAGSVFAGDAPMESPALSHACEYETSLMLHLQPHLVDMHRTERSRAASATDWVGWEDEVAYRGVSLSRRTEQVSSNGSSGEPQRGTAAKGDHLYRHALDAIESFLRSFHSWPLPEDLRHA